MTDTYDSRADRLAGIAISAAKDWAKGRMTTEQLHGCLKMGFKGCMQPMSPRLLDVGWKLLDALDNMDLREDLRNATEEFEKVFPSRPKVTGHEKSNGGP